MHSNDPDADDHLSPITAQDMARFHEHAPAALARRGAGFLVEQLAAAFETLLTGVVPIVGMLVYDWSAGQLLLFLLVGAWCGIVLDLLKLLLRYRAVQRFGAVRYDDWHVWLIAQSLRKGKSRAPTSHLQARYQPEMGVVVDLLAGGVGTAFILLALATGSSDGWAELGRLLRDRSMLHGLAAVVGYRLAVTLWELFTTRGSTYDGEVKVAVGMRGLGLFVLMFVVVMIRESAGVDGSMARGTMLAVNIAISAYGFFNMVGQYWLARETRWLRQYLDDRRAAVARRTRGG